MNLKQQIENHAVIYVLGMLLTGFLSGIGAATWVHKERTQILEDKSKSQVEQIDYWKSEAQKYKVLTPQKDHKRIQILNSGHRGSEVVAMIQNLLDEVGNFDPQGYFVTPGSSAGVKDYAAKMPDLLIIHRHAFEREQDNLLLDAIKLYIEGNKKIKILVFSESFLYKDGWSAFKNRIEPFNGQVEMIGFKYNDLPNSSLNIRNKVLSMLNEV